jgi:hypothetical protein
MGSHRTHRSLFDGSRDEPDTLTFTVAEARCVQLAGDAYPEPAPLVASALAIAAPLRSGD